MTTGAQDIEARLRADLDQLADLLIAETDPSPDGSHATSAVRKRGRLALLGVAAAASVVVGGITMAIWGSDTSHNATVGGPPGTIAKVHPDATTRPTGLSNNVSPALPGVEAASSPPLATRVGVATAWTGTEVVVWGGHVDALTSDMEDPNQGFTDGGFTDGAAFNPTSGTWRSIPPAPIPESTDTSVAAATNTGVVVVRGTATAVWDPASNSWRVLSNAPSRVTNLVGSGDLAVSASAGAVLNVRTGEWQLLPPPPVILDRPTTVWTGREVVMLGGPGTPFTQAAALVLDPITREWRETSKPPERLRAEALAATWDGKRVVVANYDMHAAAYDPISDTWEDLPDVPARFYEWLPSARTSTAGPVVEMGQALAVLGDGGWTPLPTAGYLSLAGAPTEPGAPLTTWHLSEDGRSNQLILIDLATLIASGRRRVSVADVALPPGTAQVSTSIDAAGDVIKINLARGANSCTVTSRYSASAGTDEFTLPIIEAVEGRDGAVQWSRNESSTQWQTAATSSDRVEVVCDESTDARALVAGIVP